MPASSRKRRARRRSIPIRRSTRRPDAPLPAPGDLRLFQDFLNTFGPGERADELATPEGLVRWLTDRDLMPDAAELSEADRQRAVTFRDAMREVVAGAVPLRRELRATLDWAVSKVQMRARFSLEEGIRMEPAVGGLDGAIGRLMVIVTTAQGAAVGTWEYLGTCANEACRTVYFDDSLDRAATWCRPRCGGKVRFLGLRRRRTRYDPLADLYDDEYYDDEYVDEEYIDEEYDDAESRDEEYDGHHDDAGADGDDEGGGGGPRLC